MKIAKILLSIFGLFITAIFVIPLFLHCTINIGTCTGILMGILLIVLGIFIERILSFLKNIYQKKIGKIVIWFVGIMIVAIAALVSVETVLMIKAATKAPEEGATVVVLGCRVYDNKPSKTLKSRLDAAYDYLVAHEDSVCVVSGGKGTNETMSEADCMYEYLVERGIEPERIYVENKSRTTRENLKFTKQIIEENGLNPSIAIVTSEFHEYRAGLIAKDLGFTYGAISSNTMKMLLPTYYVRELYGIIYQWIGIGE